VQMDSRAARHNLDRAITQFCREECGTPAVRSTLTDDGQEMHSRDIAKKMAAKGWLGISIPEEYGGNGGGLLDLCTFFEVSSREMAPIGAFPTSAIVGFAYQRFGTETQKRQILTGIATGRVQALSLSEPGAGSDLSAVSCQAERVSGEFVVNGRKAWCSNAHLADHVLLLVRTSDKPGTSGSLTMLQVPIDTKGLSVHCVQSIAGRQLNDLHLESCRVPESAVIGIPGEAWLQTMAMLSFERLVIAATMVGVAQRTLDDIIHYVRHRQQFDSTLGSLQTVRHRLADLITEIECSRMLMQRAATTADYNLRRLSPLETSMAKLKATETAKKVANEGMQLTGAYGATAESNMPQHLHDSVLATIYGGTSEIQREIIASSIFPGPA
jgi:isovaleryl-CoA dehydrogenase